ncbi:hypothetical protein [Vibrio rhizosphaerae]|uniref:DUF5625 domain-containing protein n=1 Tax=Vibrio rhizosphaerae TaxID=398736 RepID=A0ABU4J072_9VIBR|nr:hypothetical protein [Vibrio rhizosphaerae]MDW6094828.1 hypothetical protein [Vibrio rhizosphaerae]
MMNLIKSVVILSLSALSFVTQAAQLPSEMVIDGVSYTVNAEEPATVVKRTMSFDLTKEESEQIEQQGFANAAFGIDFRCKGSSTQTYNFRNLSPQSTKLIKTFEQTCDDKYITADLTNSSHGSLSLYLVDTDGYVVEGFSSRISVRLPVGIYHLFVANQSSSEVGEGYVKTSYSF